MSDEKPPYRPCTICVIERPASQHEVVRMKTLRINLALYPRAQWVCSVYDAPGHPPMQFFVCDLHKDTKRCLQHCEDSFTPFMESYVMFEAYEEYYARVVTTAQAEEAIARLRGQPKGSL